jgi:uncharacterized protein (TIGR00255 family)
MVLSMTGYGKAAGTFEGKKIVVEIRSLNSKSLDLNMRLIPAYRERELELRAIVGQHLDRGKVEMSVSLENSGDSKNYTINKDLAQTYYRDIKELADLVGENTADLLGIVMRMPEIFSNEKEQLSEEEASFLNQLTQEA